MIVELGAVDVVPGSFRRPLTGTSMIRAILSLILTFALWPSAKAVAQDSDPVPDETTRAGVVREMLNQSRLLENAQFTIPLDYWKDFLRDQALAHGVVQPPPVPLIVEAGEYRLLAPAGQPPVLRATVRLHVFYISYTSPNTPVLWAKAPGGWDAVAVNGKPAVLPESDGWLRFSPAESGDYEGQIVCRVIAVNARWRFRIDRLLQRIAARRP